MPIEIYFSVIQRKVLTPNVFSSLNEVEDRLSHFQERYEEIAEPFEWKFTKGNLIDLLAKISLKTAQTSADSEQSPAMLAA